MQFSPDLNQPLMAKLSNTIYSIGEKLSNEYLDVLAFTQNQMGTAIYLNEKYLKIDAVKKTLDIHAFVELKSKNFVFLDSSLLESNGLMDGYSSNQYKRYGVVNDSYLVEIYLDFMQTPLCEGIYVYDQKAEFSCINFEIVHKPKEKSKQRSKNQSIGQKHNKMDSIEFADSTSVVAENQMLKDPYVKYHINLI